jgi:hypothetical protein
MTIDAIKDMEVPCETVSGKFAVVSKDGVLLVELDYEGTPGIFV